MKKLNKLTAVLLSLALCLGMVAPAFAASFEDLQDAIDGVVAEPATPDTPDTPSTPDTPVDIPQNGTQVEGEDEGTLGYGWNEANETGKGWDIWATENDDGGRDIELKGDVTQGEGGKDDASTIIVDDKVNIDLNDHNITGNGENTVIKVEQDGDLAITGGEGETGNTISNKPSEDAEPAEGANGIDVEGKLELDGVTITDTDTAVNVGAGGTAQIEDSTITGNNTGVAFVDSDSVTFIGDQNVVNNNKKNVDGSGRVNFTLTDEDGKETTYKVDAQTAEKLLKEKNSIQDGGDNWKQTKDGIVLFTGEETTLSNKIVKDILNSTTGATGFLIPEGVETIGTSAFYNCGGLETINIPNTVTVIGESAFHGCSNWSSEIKMPDNLKTIGSHAFRNCKNVTGILEFKSLETLAQLAFEGCANITGLSFSEGCTLNTIPKAAFNGCSSLSGNVAIPESVTSIGDSAFKNCSSLQGVTIPDGVTKIDDNTFNGCKALQTLNIPSTVTSIGNAAFMRCESLAMITIPTSVTTIGRSIFHESSVKSVWIPFEEGSEATAKLVASKTDVNIFIKADDENLTFYRGKVSADFGHNEGEDVKLEDGSVALTNVSGTITVGESAVTIPTGAPVSIDTNGNITVNAPITVGGVSCPYGATIAPDGTVTALPAPPVYDDYTDPTEVEVDDPAVPLAAGPVTRAQFVDYLWRHEGEPEGADCTFADVPADHEYVLALGWAEANGIAAADADGNFQPDELVTVEAVRAILGSFTNVFGTNAVAVADLTTLTGDDGEAVLNCDQVLAEFFGEEYILPEDLDILEPDDAA